MTGWRSGARHHQPRRRGRRPGIDDLRPAEYVDGLARARAQDRAASGRRSSRCVGVTLYRAILPLLDGDSAWRGAAADSSWACSPQTIHGARVFVLPNPSGRNANFSYAEMLAAFRTLSRAVKRL